jgi:hypothetical protein
MVMFVIALPLASWNMRTSSPWPALCVAALGGFASLRPGFFSLVIWPILALLLLGDDYIDDRTVAAWMNAEGFRFPLLASLTAIAWIGTIQRALSFGKTSEDDPYYEAAVVADPNAKVSRTFRAAAERAAWAARAKTRRAQWEASRLDRQIHGMIQQSPWRKLAVGFAERQGPLAFLAGAFLPIVLISAANVFTNEDWNWDAEILSGMGFLTGIGTAIAALMPATTLGSRIRYMATERLLPLSNQAYADAMLKICAATALRSWLAIQGIVAAFVLLPPWQNWTQPTPRDVGAYLVVSLAGLIYSYGVGMFCSSMEGCFAMLFAAATTALATIALQAYWSSLAPEDSYGRALFFSAILLAAGIAFAWRARSLWRHKELGVALSASVA